MKLQGAGAEQRRAMRAMRPSALSALVTGGPLMPIPGFALRCSVFAVVLPADISCESASTRGRLATRLEPKRRLGTQLGCGNVKCRGEQMMGVRLRIRLRVAGSLAGVVLAFSTLQTSGIPVASATEQVPFADAELQEAIDMREALGFPADPVTVSKLLQRPDANFDYGGPLSTDETRLMANRIAFEQGSTELIAFVNEHEDLFGGVWFDHPGGGSRLWVATTDAAGPETVARLSALAPAGLELRMVQVGVSLASLRRSQESVIGSEAELGVTGSYVDVTTNELVVGGSAEVALKLQRDLGVPVRAEQISLVPVACATRAACTPYRAAINLDFPNILCTWGFIAKTNLVSQLNLISAGHCATIGQGASHNSTTVTTSAGVNRNTFDMLGSQQADALRAPLKSSANLAQPYNLLYNTDTQ